MAEKRITYRAKDKTTCPCCKAVFHTELLHSGGGRMNAGELTTELHRIFLPTEKYGLVYPLIYPVIVCPQCYFAAFNKDFDKLPDDKVQTMKAETGNRKSSVRDLLPDVDFHQDRRLEEGIASYLLAMFCYELFPPDRIPTFRQANSALRASWLCREKDKLESGENWDYLANVFSRKAAFLYNQVVELDQNGKESTSQFPSLGPDIDQNYGFDGVTYLAAQLEYSYGQTNNPELRMTRLKRARSIISRIVGMGKSSKSKPGPILDRSRELHKNIKGALEELGIEN